MFIGLNALVTMFHVRRQRGYKVGSLMTGPNDPDTYYKQPGHPLSPDSERFRVSAMNDVACIQRSPVRCVRKRAT